MTSMVAVIPIASLAAANATLEGLSHGPNNFSVPAYIGPAVSHVAFHSAHDPVFEADVQALADVVWEISEGNEESRMKALIEAQGAKRGDRAPELPKSGMAEVGLYRHEEKLVYVEKAIDRTKFAADPMTYPLAIKDVAGLDEVEAVAAVGR